MCIKSVPMDHVDTIVFAIRGTSTFMDWAVNLNTAPTSPRGFLVGFLLTYVSYLCHPADLPRTIPVIFAILDFSLSPDR
jgi:hypothetical protein